ncbi:MAG TPA: ABC transporter ATP-binding protein, partial [Clostridiales bacterium]|nr:ABC transporter ATP-binding protein [Clostridiales bacterium]
NKIAYTTVGLIRKSMFDRLLVLPSSFFDRTSYGDTASRFVNDADMVSDGLLQGLMALIQGVLTIVGASVIMLILNVPMALTVMLSAPASFFVARYITLKSQKRFGQQAAIVGELNGYAEEYIDGLQLIKAFGRREKVLFEFGEINSRLYKAGLKAQIISALSNPTTRIVNNIAYAVIGVISGYLAINGLVTVGTVSGFLIFAVIYARPFNEITSVLTQIQSAFASAERIFALLDETAEPSDENAPEHIEECRGEVEFKNVYFSYDPKKPLIEDLNLHIPQGSKVAIVGPTGAGKTTLVNLLMRFYDVDSGSITVDGIDIRNLKRKNLREQFGMVLQDTWLFGGTVRQNIAYGKPDATFEEIVEAAKKAGADSFIRRMEKGYDTRIRAGGENLSAGQ